MLVISSGHTRTDGQSLDDYQPLFSILETKYQGVVPTSIRFAM